MVLYTLNTVPIVCTIPFNRASCTVPELCYLDVPAQFSFNKIELIKFREVKMTLYYFDIGVTSTSRFNK